ncbi:DUF1653 domain-containing protein [Spongiibacter nanhainus]|uniref:DUF1653 domain-containing protein n=1 Tax=Spongiibacter nanhainus TaxID=2794344 RepID=UPI003080AE61
MNKGDQNQNLGESGPAQPRPGRYRHYKGGEYWVYSCATHSETEQQLVVYRPLYGDRELWVRPVEMFMEDVEIEGKRRPRFAWVNDDPEGAPAL